MAKQPKVRLNEFVWEGTDRKGKIVKGGQEAPNTAFIRTLLRRQGIKPKKIRRKPQPLFAKSIKSKDLALSSRQIATMFAAGIPLAQCLNAIGRDGGHPKLYKLFTSIRQDVESGSSMSSSLIRYPQYFDRLFISLVRVGEQSGTLDKMLDKIALYLEKTEAIKGQIKSAMFYPIMVIFVTIVVVAIMLLFVVPQFEVLFKNVGSDLPLLTRWLVTISEWFQKWWWAFFIGSFGFFTGLTFFYKRSESLQYILHNLQLHIPGFGGTFKKAIIARIVRTLATMFGAGVPLVDALDSIAEVSGNKVYEKAMLQVRDDVSSGQSIERSMAQTELFPNMVLQMVSTGEESGELEGMLNKAADFYEQEVDNAVATIANLIEPIMIVILGGIIGTIVVAMYLPVFKLASAF